MRGIFTHAIAFSAGLAIGAIAVFAISSRRQPTAMRQVVIQSGQEIPGEREISYQRWEYTWPDPEDRVAPLLTFVYDVPYLGACRVFPPLHILNEILATGGSDGGMSPGATWEPFEVSSAEYNALVQAIMTLDPRTLGEAARYRWPPFIFDPSFDHIEAWSDWVTAVCAKHVEAFHDRIVPPQSGPE